MLSNNQRAGVVRGEVAPAENAVPCPDVMSYRLCMEACRRGGDAAGTLSTLARLRAEGLEPDLVSVCVVFVHVCMYVYVWVCEKRERER